MEYNEDVNQTADEEIGIPKENDVPNEEAHEDTGREGRDETPTEGETPSDTPKTPEGEAGVEEEKEW